MKRSDTLEIKAQLFAVESMLAFVYSRMKADGSTDIEHVLGTLVDKLYLMQLPEGIDTESHQAFIAGAAGAVDRVMKNALRLADAEDV